MSANKVILYVALIFIYLGLSKALSPSELGISYVNNNESLSELIRGEPLTVILIDVHSTGFIIKTYYHKYRIVYGFQTYEELIVRVARGFMQQHKDHIGLSIMSRSSNGEINYSAHPPGNVFIGDTSFGNWRRAKNSSDPVWKFHRAYRYLPKYLGIEEFVITKKFYEKVLYSRNEKNTFLGFNDEFGPSGEVTRKAFPTYFSKKKEAQTDFKQYIKNYFKKNFYNSP